MKWAELKCLLATSRLAHNTRCAKAGFPLRSELAFLPCRSLPILISICPHPRLQIPVIRLLSPKLLCLSVLRPHAGAFRTLSTNQAVLFTPKAPPSAVSATSVPATNIFNMKLDLGDLAPVC